jgi:hypothetical protein
MTTPIHIHNKERQAALAIFGGVASTTLLPSDTPAPIKIITGTVAATCLYASSFPGNEGLRAVTSLVGGAVGTVVCSQKIFQTKQNGSLEQLQLQSYITL